VNKLPEIKQEEWMAEIDKLRPQDTLTVEQYNRIAYAREQNPPVIWRDIVKLWEAWGYGKININTLKNRYYNYLS